MPLQLSLCCLDFSARKLDHRNMALHIVSEKWTVWTDFQQERDYIFITAFSLTAATCTHAVPNVLFGLPSGFTLDVTDVKTGSMVDVWESPRNRQMTLKPTFVRIVSEMLLMTRSVGKCSLTRTTNISRGCLRAFRWGVQINHNVMKALC